MTERFVKEVLDFQKEVFPTSTSLSKLHHLQKEVPELIAEVEKHYHNAGDLDATKKEYADCFLLLIGSAAQFGLSAKDIRNVVRRKIKINRKRKWGEPDINGVIQHVNG